MLTAALRVAVRRARIVASSPPTSWTSAASLANGSGTTSGVDASASTVNQSLAGTPSGRPFAPCWWKFTATTATPVTITTRMQNSGGYVDAYLGIWDGDPTVTTGGSNTDNMRYTSTGSRTVADASTITGTNLVGYDDDAGGNGQGKVIFTPTIGKTYYIAAGIYPQTAATGDTAQVIFSGINT